MAERADRGQRRAVRHNWLILGGAFATFALAMALMQSYPVFLLAYIEAFGWSRAETSVAFSVAQLVAGMGSPLVGALVDRLGPRRLMLLGGALLMLGAAGNSAVSALWQVVVLYGVVMTTGASCLGLVVFAPLLSRHFVRRRGMAVAILQSANGFGRAVATPSAQLLISGFGWRGAYLAEGALVAVLLLPLASLFRRPEPESGHAALAPASAAAAAARPPSASWSLAQAAKTREFWLLFAVYLFTGIGSFLVSLHQLAFAVSMGFDKLYAAGVLGFGAALSVIGIIFIGSLSDYIGRELAALFSYAVSILGTLCALFISGPHDGVLLWLFSSLFGLTWGARGPAITAKTADLFPGRQLGRILGVITIGSGIGSALGALSAGVIFDLSGSYRLAFILSIAAYCCGGLALWVLRRPRRSAPARDGGCR
ncbi:MAG TPA: MFS transporter [Stellaceae bacterium]|nr:MFS transporter [Stellaceae bacterium]